MKTKIYLNEWFFNVGLIGFIRILEHNEDNFLTVKDNYVEFDTNDLKNFHEYYFKYFFDKYNVGEKIENRVKSSFEKIKFYLKDEAESKETLNKVKQEEKYIKTFIKSQLDKLKKIDIDKHSEVLEAYNNIDKIKTKDDISYLEKIQDVIVKNFYIENINKKITSNLFKSILSSTYFGQPSFLNVAKNALNYEEQQRTMYIDYISNIVENGVLEDILDDKYSIEELTDLLNDKIESQLISKRVIPIYTNIIKKFIKKDKTIDEIKSYIVNDVFSYCSICGNKYSLVSDYTEANFVPLAISSDNMRNFFWNQNVKFPICDICRLILFCIPAGVTSIIKTTNENGAYIENEMLSFINYDTDIETLLTTNNNFLDNSKKERNQYNPYGDLILNVVEQNKKITDWELQNIFVIEFEAKFSAYSRIQYFNIKRHVAKLFKNYSYLLNSIKDYKYKLQIIDYILKNKDYTNVINSRLRAGIGQTNSYSFNSYMATKIQYTLEILKREDINVEEDLKRANAKIHLMYKIGNEIHAELKKENNQNKLDGYIYQMLNCIKTNNRKGFTDIAIRILWSVQKDVPEILVKNNDNINWQELGHSFIAGLSSEEYNGNKEEIKDEK